MPTACRKRVLSLTEIIHQNMDITRIYHNNNSYRAAGSRFQRKAVLIDI